MKREILFRGKWNDIWVYGDLRQYSETHIGIYSYDLKRIVKGVDPETVGQYTGLIDKSGKKVFEGDIVCVTQATKDLAVIKYDERVSAFGLIWLNSDKCNFMLDFYLRYGKLFTNIFEVVGNIYDNPERIPK